MPEFQMIAPDQRPQLYMRLLQDIADGRLPERRLRSNPRVVKRKMSKFRLKRPEHDHWPQPTQQPFRNVLTVLSLASGCTAHLNAFVEALESAASATAIGVI